MKKDWADDGQCDDASGSRAPRDGVDGDYECTHDNIRRLMLLVEGNSTTSTHQIYVPSQRDGDFTKTHDGCDSSQFLRSTLDAG